MKELIDYNIDVLLRIDQLLAQLSDQEISQKLAMLFGSTMGDHFRHIIEFYQCLLSNLENGEFSYDKRKRNLSIATETQIARSVIAEALETLEKIRLSVADEIPLVMWSELPGYQDLFSHNTSLKRELAYLADHGVHHLAIIRIALQEQYPHIEIDGSLGVAASTVNYRNQ